MRNPRGAQNPPATMLLQAESPPFRVPSENAKPRRVKAGLPAYNSGLWHTLLPAGAVKGGAAETAAGAAGQLAQTSLLNAPILSGRACTRNYFVLIF